MQLSELVNLVNEKRKDINKEKIEAQLRDVLQLLSEMRDSLEKIREVKLKMLDCSEEIDEIRKSILSSSDPRTIITLINVLYSRTVECYKRKEEERKKRIEETKKRIAELNEKLMLYKRIFRNVIGENVEVHLLNDRSEDLDAEIKMGEDELDRLYKELKSRVGDRLDLLIKLIENEELRITSDNYEKVMELIRYLVNKGIPISLRLSK